MSFCIFGVVAALQLLLWCGMHWPINMILLRYSFDSISFARLLDLFGGCFQELWYFVKESFECVGLLRNFHYWKMIWICSFGVQIIEIRKLLVDKFITIHFNHRLFQRAMQIISGCHQWKTDVKRLPNRWKDDLKRLFIRNEQMARKFQHGYGYTTASLKLHEIVGGAELFLILCASQVVMAARHLKNELLLSNTKNLWMTLS